MFTWPDLLSKPRDTTVAFQFFFFFLRVFNLFGAWQINLHMFIDLWISSYNYSDYVSFCALISCLIHAIDELHQVLLLCWCQLLVTFSVICFTL